MTKLKPCPVCGARAYVHKDVVDGCFFMGYSAGCPRFYIGDGIHGINSVEESFEKSYAVHGLATKEEAINAWNTRANEKGGSE